MNQSITTVRETQNVSANASWTAGLPSWDYFNIWRTVTQTTCTFAAKSPCWGGGQLIHYGAVTSLLFAHNNVIP